MHLIYFAKKVFHLRACIILLIIACSIVIIFKLIVLQQIRNFEISSNLTEINQNLKSPALDDFNASKYFDNIRNVPEANKNWNPDEKNLAGKYAEFIGINKTISFENEFRWPPFDVYLRNEVNRALNGQSEEHPRIDHWSKFPVLASPKCSEKGMAIKNSLLIMVRTGAERNESLMNYHCQVGYVTNWSIIHLSFLEFFETLLYIRTASLSSMIYRNVVRETYGRLKQLKLKDQREFTFHFVFVMGIGNDKVMNEVREEIHKFNDILLADFEDNYYTSTIKFIHASKFGHRNCLIPNGSFPYVLLIDDNYFFLPWNLAEEAVKHDPNEHLYMGAVIGHVISRNKMDKWSVTLSQYPFDEYPKFVSGGAVLFSRRTIQELFLAIQHIQLYIFDDVYTGIMVKLLGIQPQPNQYFMSDMFSIQIPNSNNTTKLINADGWWKTVIAAMDFSPEMLRKKFAEAENLFHNDL